MLHTEGGESVLLSCGTGFIVTETLKVVGLVQPFAVKVYTYVTIMGAAVVFISLSPGSPVPVAVGLLIPVTAVRLQVNVVPIVELVGL